MLRFYRLLSMLSGPLLYLLLLWRVRAGKEDKQRIAERRGVAGAARPAGRLLWIHAASIGEALSALPLAQKFLKTHSDLTVLFTTGTLTSAQILMKLSPGRVLHQFVPLDHPKWVARFLDHWRPDMAVWIESEIWPNLMLETAGRRIPMALVNGRMSSHSFRRWRMGRPAMERLLTLFGVMLAHDEQSAAFFSELGAKRVQFVGDLKRASDPLPVDEEELARLEAAIGARPVWLAASTHDGEEKAVKRVHEKLLAEFPSLLTLIAPRHANRGDEIANMLGEGNLRVARRSKGEVPLPETGIYLADTMGEMGLIYRLAKIVFVGGSLVRHGGQNPLEPARLGAAILYGPHVENFSEIYDALESKGAARWISDRHALERVVAGLLRDPRTVNMRGLAGKAYAIAGRDKVLDRIVEAIGPLLPEA
ncbi:MAG TPA: 3-deoxy-D-manno-octulosonic acid transferase [Alphaproteobacteria bacterium]|jgi:3-deoxy-D-manno-octulosonic-acid transferase|nr:3-deoxy-D-manno-octulosonic acid transferase [Alphaproteobacteria bacterium]